MDLLTQAELAVQQGEYAQAVGMVHAAFPGIAKMSGSSDVDRFWATVRRVTGVQSTSGHWKFTVWSCSAISEEDARFVVRFATRLKRCAMRYATVGSSTTNARAISSTGERSQKPRVSRRRRVRHVETAACTDGTVWLYGEEGVRNRPATRGSGRRSARPPRG